jgi:hypothetical protein
MKTRKQSIFFLVLFSSFFSLCDAQEDLEQSLSEFRFNQFYKAVVVDKADNTPISYVSIGIAGTTEGTVSDKNGLFTLRIPDELHEKTFRVSHVSYFPFEIRVDSMLNEPKDTFFLEKKPVKTTAKNFQPKKYKEKILGNKRKKPLIVMSMRSPNEGFEMGVLLPIKKQARLKEFSLDIYNCTYDSIFYRINIYKQTGTLSFENILDEPIYIFQKTEEGSKNICFDLTPYNVIVEGKTLLTLENIKSYSEGEINPRASLRGHRTYGRESSHADWEKLPLVTVAMSVKADVEK